MNIYRLFVAMIACSFGATGLYAETCQFPGSPEPASAVSLKSWTTGLARPVDLRAAPGQDDRLYVAEQAGLIRVIDRGTLRPAAFLDIRDRVTAIGAGGDERGLLGLVFHPSHGSNGRFYVNYTTRGTLRTRISEFRTGSNGQGDPQSEKILIEVAQPFSNHNGGGLAFGPDGFFYISLGDGGSANDPQKNGQNLRTLLAKILRIDVNSGVPYAIPPDNPRFADLLAKREIFAYGLRNPWRISFDTLTGRLWAGDVGQNTFEEVNIIESGGNYGWNTMEGTNCFLTAGCNQQGLTPPIHQYPRSEGISITGGYVYRGAEIPDLIGAYLFSDYGSGKIWGLRYSPENAPGNRSSVKTLLQTGRNIIAFGQDTKGELYVSDLAGNVLKIVAASQQEPSVFPKKLSETGCFSSLSPLIPEPGFVSYDVAHPLWSDGTHKTRMIKLPEGADLSFSTAPISGSSIGSLEFPEKTVLIKNFFAPVKEPGGSVRHRILETRVLIRRDGFFSGYSYRWNEDETDATLLADAVTRRVHFAEPSGEVPVDYYYPSRGDCARCHTLGAGGVLGFQPAQLNKEYQAPDGTTHNQIKLLADHGIFNASTVPQSFEQIAKLIKLDDPSAGPTEKARSYLHVNCAGCHNPATNAGQVALDFREGTPLAGMGACNALPHHGDLGVPGARGIVPGEPDKSLIWLRLVSGEKSRRMPPLGSTRLDETASEAIRQWISQLSSCDQQ